MTTENSGPAFLTEHLSTPIRYRCDVLVVGGGVAGIAAALSAARAGKEVLLLERSYTLGGLATAGLVTIYLPLCDGLGHQVSFGIAEELLRMSVEAFCDRGRGYENWLGTDTSRRGADDPRFEVQFNPVYFAIRAEQLLRSHGVKILYGATAVAAPTQDGSIRAVVIESKSGREAICAGSVVDATGDADIAALSGAPTARYGKGNVMAGWYYFHEPDGWKLKMLGEAYNTDGNKTRGGRNDRPAPRRISGLDTEEISEIMYLSHDATLRDVLARRATYPAAEPTTVTSIPQLRMTRRIAGEYTLDQQEQGVHFSDSVGAVSDWRRRGPVYEVPFRTLYSARVRNLICAGRCTSVTDDMWDIMRVIPCCAVTGEAAGTAAAMTDDFAALSVPALQEKLVAAGVRLHPLDRP